MEFNTLVIDASGFLVNQGLVDIGAWGSTGYLYNAGSIVTTSGTTNIESTGSYVDLGGSVTGSINYL